MRIKFFSEASLIEECIKGNIRAQKELYEVHARKLFAVCFRYASSYEEAEDFLQDSFIRIFEKLKEYNADHPFEGWLKKVAINISIRGFRSRNSNEISYDDDTNHIDIIDEETPLECLSTKELIEMITKIPLDFRQVLNLYAIDGFSHKEIATILNISEENSRQKLTRARNILTQIMSNTKKESHASIER